MSTTSTPARAVLRRIAAVGVATMAAAGVSVVAASPAQATSTDCRNYLANAGYIVGPQVTRACDDGAKGTAEGFSVCRARLIGLGVTVEHARWACTVAAVRP